MKDAPLSKSPDGLLGSLDLKSLGENPGVLGSVLEPSYDVTPYYLLRNRACLTGSGPWAAVNTAVVMALLTGPPGYFPAGGGNFTVPQLEVLRIKSLAVVNVRAAADAALNLDVQISIKRFLTNAFVPIGSVTFPARPATDLQACAAMNLTEPLWLGPGDQLLLIPTTTQTAAGSAIRLGLDFDTMQSG